MADERYEILIVARDEATQVLDNVERGLTGIGQVAQRQGAKIEKFGSDFATTAQQFNRSTDQMISKLRADFKSGELATDELAASVTKNLDKSAGSFAKSEEAGSKWASTLKVGAAAVVAGLALVSKWIFDLVKDSEEFKRVGKAWDGFRDKLSKSITESEQFKSVIDAVTKFITDDLTPAALTFVESWMRGLQDLGRIIDTYIIKPVQTAYGWVQSLKDLLPGGDGGGEGVFLVDPDKLAKVQEDMKRRQKEFNESLNVGKNEAQQIAGAFVDTKTNIEAAAGSLNQSFKEALINAKISVKTISTMIAAAFGGGKTGTSDAPGSEPEGITISGGAGSGDFGLKTAEDFGAEFQQAIQDKLQGYADDFLERVAGPERQGLGGASASAQVLAGNEGSGALRDRIDAGAESGSSFGGEGFSFAQLFGPFLAEWTAFRNSGGLESTADELLAFRDYLTGINEQMRDMARSGAPAFWEGPAVGSPFEAARDVLALLKETIMERAEEEGLFVEPKDALIAGFEDAFAIATAKELEILTPLEKIAKEFGLTLFELNELGISLGGTMEDYENDIQRVRDAMRENITVTLGAGGGGGAGIAADLGLVAPGTGMPGQTPASPLAGPFAEFAGEISNRFTSTFGQMIEMSREQDDQQHEEEMTVQEQILAGIKELGRITSRLENVESNLSATQLARALNKLLALDSAA